jgi:hypothetical protein
MSEATDGTDAVPSAYLDNAARDDRLSGGVRRIPVSTDPLGKFEAVFRPHHARTLRNDHVL